MLGAHGTPILGGRGGPRGSAMARLERAMLVSHRLSIVTVALTVTIRPQFAIECLWRSNHQGVGDFGPKFRGCSPWSRPVMSGLQELTNGEIIFEEFQPTVWVKKIPLRGPEIFHFFTNGWEFLIDFLHTYTFLSTLHYKFLFNYPSILTELCHIKRDYPVHIICSKCPLSAKTHTFRRLCKSLIALLIVVCGKSL